MSNSNYEQYPIGSTFNVEGIPDSVTTIGWNPAVNGGHPLVSIPDNNYSFRKDVLRDILAFLKRPSSDALYVTGPTGSGKTSAVVEIASRLNWPVQQVTCHGRMEVTDLIGFHSLTAEKAGDQPSMKFMYGPLANAMREGHILLLNEIDLMNAGELSGLNDILEGRPLIIASNGGEVIKPHPMFRIIVTGNSVGQGDQSGLYQGIQMQNVAAMDRYRIITIDYAETDVEMSILEKVAGDLPKTMRKKMIDVATSVRRLFTGDDENSGEINVTMSTRTLVRWANLTLDFKGAPNTIEYALKQALLNRCSLEEQTAILRVAKDAFGAQWK